MDASNPAGTGRTVVCSPHFDDAVLGCWSVLERDRTSEVINVFTAAPGDGFTAWWDQLNGASSSAAHVRDRFSEDRNALALAGKTPIALGMLENQYRLRPSALLHALFRHAPPIRYAMLRVPGLQQALYSVPVVEPEQLADCIARAVPDASTVCLPAGIGGHPDHLTVRRSAVVLAMRGMSVRLYADMPYAVRNGWPRWICAPDGAREIDRAGQFWTRHLQALRPFVAEPLREATVVRLTEGERKRKARAVRHYATQFSALNGGRSRGRLDDEGSFAYEVYWQLRPPLGGSRLET
jgi:LmbE family N-acetylglucosaminyl deacetylase